jgi:hypothetical protein
MFLAELQKYVRPLATDEFAVTDGKCILIPAQFFREILFCLIVKISHKIFI